MKYRLPLGFQDGYTLKVYNFSKSQNAQQLWLLPK